MSDFRPLVERLARSAAVQPGAEAVVFGAARVRYGQLWRDVCAVAGFLRQTGVQPGDRVAVVLENSPEYVTAYYGALAAGAVAVGLNHAARARELASWVDHCGAALLIADVTHPDFREFAQSARAVITVGGRTGEHTVWERVLSAPPVTPVLPAEDALAAITYTSGTTGRPKGVTLTHGNLSANTSSILEYLDLRPHDRVLNVLPFFYSYGSSVLHTHLAAGGTLILENSLAFPQRLLAKMQAERATGLPGVPSTFGLLLQTTDLTKFDLSSLRYVTQAGGAMPSALIAKVRAALPDVQLFIMYGQTEATARLTYLPPAMLTAKLGSVGIPVRGVDIDIRREDGTRAGVGERGEVCARGANVMRGYYRDEAATAGVLRDGWLRTGDIGYLDPDGYLYLEGRRADIIKSGAHRISPLDIEEVIASLPEVSEVAVVGVPDPVLGEAIKAVITLHAGGEVDAMAVQRHCSRHLPRYKVPKYVEFAAQLPRTASGKLIRYRLAAGDRETSVTI